MGTSDTVPKPGEPECSSRSDPTKARPLFPHCVIPAVLLVAVLAPAAGAETPAPTPAPKLVVVLKDGTRYTLSKPYETRGSQARFHLANGTLVSVRASEIDVEMTKRAALGQGAPTPPVEPGPRRATEVGSAPAGLERKVPLGSRVKLDKEKAETLFRQDVVADPSPAPPAAEAPSAHAETSAQEGFAAMMKADLEAEKQWREREADRLARLDVALEAQREICARYVAAVNSSGTQDGWVSDAAGAILGALKADCDTATRKVDAVHAERERLEEDCRKTQGCQPGWLR